MSSLGRARRETRRGGVLALLLLGAVAAHAAQPASPAPLWLPARPTRYITDETGRLDAARVAALNDRLAAFERETSAQVLVYVAAKIPAGTTLEEFAFRAANTWGIGQKDKDNGVLFAVFLDDRRMRLEVGYGLEGPLSNEHAKEILDKVVKPRFKARDFIGGIEDGADAVMAAARGECSSPCTPPAGTARPSPGGRIR